MAALPAHMLVCHLHAWSPQRLRGTWIPCLELELQTVVSCCVDAGNEPRFSGIAANALDRCDRSPNVPFNFNDLSRNGLLLFHQGFFFSPTQCINLEFRWDFHICMACASILSVPTSCHFYFLLRDSLLLLSLPTLTHICMY